MIERAFTVAKRIDLFDSTYSHFTRQVLETIRKETFGQDIGQNSWTTVDEYDRFLSWLDLRPEHHVLEVASGSGGPGLYVANRAGCRLLASTLTRQESLQPLRARPTQIKLIA